MEAEAGRKYDWSPHTGGLLSWRLSLDSGFHREEGAQGEEGNWKGDFPKAWVLALRGTSSRKHSAPDQALPGAGGDQPTLMRQAGVGRLRPVGTSTPTPRVKDTKATGHIGRSDLLPTPAKFWMILQTPGIVPLKATGRMEQG